MDLFSFFFKKNIIIVDIHLACYFFFSSLSVPVFTHFPTATVAHLMMVYCHVKKLVPRSHVKHLFSMTCQRCLVLALDMDNARRQNPLKAIIPRCIAHMISSISSLPSYSFIISVLDTHVCSFNWCLNLFIYLFFSFIFLTRLSRSWVWFLECDFHTRAKHCKFWQP